MEGQELNIISMLLGVIIGFFGSFVVNVLYNAAVYLKYEVYKKEKDFKKKRKEDKK